ncbi:hypothetical protein [Paenibacillus shenyangensis]|uniref:hypothetical protein n=1 Tax=Paenibacillus sp. A9 TaxID=1284352 RepID=UPI00037BA58C|nr:hypothetical protein [Paenibacillus sp. A9]
MKPEDVFHIIEQYNAMNQQPWWKAPPTIISIIAVSVAAASAYIARSNVNKTKESNWNNELLKFERDLRFKAVDELVETLTELKQVYTQFTGMKQMIWTVFKGKGSMEMLNNHIDKHSKSEYESNLKMATRMKQRKIVIGRYEPRVEKIYTESFTFYELITELRQRLYIPDHQTITVIAGEKETTTPVTANDQKTVDSDGTVTVTFSAESVEEIVTLAQKIDQFAKEKVTLLDKLMNEMQNEEIVPYLPSKKLFNKNKKTKNEEQS